MSLAYLCDNGSCDNKHVVEPGLAAILPKGWTAVDVAKGEGVQNVPKKSFHLCPMCGDHFQKTNPTVLKP